MLGKITHASLIAFLASHTVFANDDIIVTADRIKSTLEKSPSDIKVFEQDEIKKSSSMIELLSRESDLTLSQSGPMGGNISLFLRGTESYHVLVVIDGIVMNDPSNPTRQFDLGRLSLNNIERVEILKGSQGLLYGSNAIGGVVVITTKKGSENLSGSGFVDYGTFGTLNAGVNAQKKFNKTSVSFGADHLNTEGFSAANDSRNPNAEKDGEKRTTLNAGVSQEIAKGEFNLNYRYVNDKVDLDKGGGAGEDDPNDSQFTEQKFMKAGYTQNWSSGETTLNLTRSEHHRTLNVRSDSNHPTASSTTSKGEINGVAINHTQYFNDFFTQNYNFDYQHEEDQKKNSNENFSFFLYNRFEFGPAVVNAGARLDSNQSFGEHVTYKIALMHFFSAFNLKMAYSTGFRAPSLNQLHAPIYGNKNLTPEESQTAEIGVEVPVTENGKYTGTLFYTDIKDRLSYAPVTFINQNRGRARIIGVENVFNAKLMEGLNSNTSVTWLSARDMTAKKKLARRPNINVKTSVDFAPSNKELVSIEGDFTGKRNDVDNLGNTVHMPSFLIFNLRYEREFRANTSIYLKVKNLLDRDYEEVYGYGTGGRIASVGLRYVF
ncbi:TonB-dependent receptor [Bacteriovorax stolpii]|uniref:Uncharacterized protein n=1 Tax=Bacteriovorax stolpii TaxID=960 RepID=A0A2K9NMP9_BACTC|nr:TonB-dependent receptor [Bacteriovorax stolpii]AUN96796.1 hypothetical protein C0V70_01485 [Bacteriovorax stolpii]QDK43273.1 TonB-dependent receptor [Bacteriovorax stolpii]TDP53073.1 vitamin B12 transporter [Bacteriovorax stolpii]